MSESETLTFDMIVVESIDKVLDLCVSLILFLTHTNMCSKRNAEEFRIQSVPTLL